MLIKFCHPQLSFTSIIRRQNLPLKKKQSVCKTWAEYTLPWSILCQNRWRWLSVNWEKKIKLSWLHTSNGCFAIFRCSYHERDSLNSDKHNKISEGVKRWCSWWLHLMNSSSSVTSPCESCLGASSCQRTLHTQLDILPTFPQVVDSLNKSLMKAKLCCNV